jgi:hypothetical protein
MQVFDVAVVEADRDEAFGGAGHHDPSLAARSGAAPPRTDGFGGEDSVADVELRWFLEGGPGCHADHSSTENGVQLRDGGRPVWSAPVLAGGRHGLPPEDSDGFRHELDDDDAEDRAPCASGRGRAMRRAVAQAASTESTCCVMTAITMFM